MAASLCQWRFETRIFGSGWIQGVCADVLSHTWPVGGGDQSRTTPMPFQRIQRISVALQTTPEEPKQRNGPLGAPKRRPDPPTAGTPPAPARVRRKPRRWNALVPIWGGSPVAVPRPPAPQAQFQSFWQCPRPLIPPGRKPNGTSRQKLSPLPAELRKLKKDSEPKFSSLNKIELPVRTHGRYCGRLWWPSAQTLADTVSGVAMQWCGGQVEIPPRESGTRTI
jgi:hypothetical protein